MTVLLGVFFSHIDMTKQILSKLYNISSHRITVFMPVLEIELINYFPKHVSLHTSRAWLTKPVEVGCDSLNYPLQVKEGWVEVGKGNVAVKLME